MAGFFSKIKDAQGRQGSLELTAGTYELEITKAGIDVTNHKKATFFGLGIKVLELVEGDTSSRPVGFAGHYRVFFSNPYADGEIKEIIAAGLGIPQEAVDEAGAEACSGPQSILIGRRIRARVWINEGDPAKSNGRAKRFVNAEWTKSPNQAPIGAA